MLSVSYPPNSYPGYPWSFSAELTFTLSDQHRLLVTTTVRNLDKAHALPVYVRVLVNARLCSSTPFILLPYPPSLSQFFFLFLLAPVFVLCPTCLVLAALLLPFLPPLLRYFGYHSYFKVSSVAEACLQFDPCADYLHLHTQGSNQDGPLIPTGSAEPWTLFHGDNPIGALNTHTHTHTHTHTDDHRLVFLLPVMIQTPRRSHHRNLKF